jgi:Flp pilus assembly protein TadB
MTFAILVAMVAAAAVVMLLRGIFAPAPSLADLAAGTYQNTALALSGMSFWDQMKARINRALPASMVLFGDFTHDLRITRSSVEDLVVQKVIIAAFGFIVPLAGWAVLRVVGMNIPIVFFIFGGLLFAFFGFLFPDLVLRDKAKRRRAEFESAFASYLNLTKILIAASDGPESALDRAAAQGDGWVFAEIRAALAIARGDARLAHWDALGNLGHELDIQELREFANAMSSTATSATLPLTLAARAESLQSKALTRIREDAESRTEQMDIPLSMFTASLSFFLIYAALQVALGAQFSP